MKEPAARFQADADFDQYFASAILESELLRIAILVGTCGLAVLIILCLQVLLPAIRGTFVTIQVTAGITGLIVYELLMRRFVARRLARARPVSRTFWFVNASIEVTLATTIMLSTYSAFRSPIHLLTAPAFGFYFALILLTTLRLDRDQSIFTGSVAGAQYAMLAAYIVSTTPRPTEPLLGSIFYYSLMASSLIVAAIGAGLVAQEIRTRTYRVMAEREKRNRVVSLFGQFVSPALVDEILQRDADLTSQRRHVCIMFLDIRGFTPSVPRFTVSMR